MSYTRPIRIEFNHCDPAGIVFYPRYVEMLNDVVEHWFQHALGCSFAQLHLERALALDVTAAAAGPEYRLERYRERGLDPAS